MGHYLTEAAYKRWYRQYQVSIGFYLDVVDSLRVRMDALPLDKDKFEDKGESKSEGIEDLFSELNDKFDLATPRNFNANGEPLVGFEKFSENCKVFVNLIDRLLGKPDRFLGIYHDEKTRVLKVHQEYKFKDQINILKEKIEALESEPSDEYVVAQNPAAVS